jgi:RNA-directed DNA polymerase
LIISEMQHKLATWAKEDRTRRFDRLFRLIANRDWLAEAARIVLASSGAHTPGIDGMDKRRLERGLDQHLARLQADLLKGVYRPQPVKRVYIPKPNGKLRPLGIPTLTDRIVQRAMLMAMEPIWESDFHRSSHGFRPERSVHHAVRTVKLQLQDGTDSRGRWIIEGDLASYFDTVHHRLLVICVRRRVRDRRLVDLLWRILKAGHIDRGLFTASSEGVPQGGVLSPLLSNIMLHEFDAWLEAKYLNKRPERIAGHGTSASRRGVQLRSARTGNGSLLSPIVAMPMILSSSSKGQRRRPRPSARNAGCSWKAT